MKGGDKLPVLAFPTPRKTGPRPRAADPRRLARAAEALRAATAAAPEAQAAPARPAVEAEETFTPVGIPRWRAGPDAPRDPARQGRMADLAGAEGRDGATERPRRRILSLHLPRFAIERWQTAAARAGEPWPEDAPLALALEGPHGPVIHAVNAAAAMQGLAPGARVVDMRALCPELRTRFADPRGDAAARRRLMLWARRWCPWTATDGTDGLIMDITGSDHLWGGEAAMRDEIETRLATLGLTGRAAIAPTRGAAWALARFAPAHPACDDPLAACGPLPVAALRLEPDTVLALDRLGLSTIGALAEVPRLSLARRFRAGPPETDPLLRLDQLSGRTPEPVDSPDDPPRFAVQARLPEPVIDPVPHIPALAEELCAGLSAAGFGARRVVLTLYRTDGEVAQAQAATSQPSRDPAHLVRLFGGRLDRLDPGFGFDLVTLAALVAEALPTRQRRLDGAAEAEGDLARLIDRLAARFGAHALTRPWPAPSHIPERQTLWRPALHVPSRPYPARPDRPLRLFEPPEEIRVLYAVPEGPPAQFVWRRQRLRVARFAGPERIAPEWWRDRPGTRLRDYYRIEDHTGRRFWLYREGLLHDGRGAEPRWFLHGAFA
ncbi:Y-family DNA polymerase [Limimaricola pyoseonensis]|uniref:DNA-directed DNA polymerase n=1 Tax=Limimaricola pyoseonensis TaxID=521013 RepID=A0A1G7DMK4_9RHOB|nr:DNA polymerase Y family protein [Limimaricola pyoseonensis]SDE52350.1 protein ImuB [Limimaricola pyoseonensis]